MRQYYPQAHLSFMRLYLHISWRIQDLCWPGVFKLNRIFIHDLVVFITFKNFILDNFDLKSSILIPDYIFFKSVKKVWPNLDKSYKLYNYSVCLYVFTSLFLHGWCFIIRGGQVQTSSEGPCHLPFIKWYICLINSTSIQKNST